MQQPPALLTKVSAVGLHVVAEPAVELLSDDEGRLVQLGGILDALAQLHLVGQVAGVYLLLRADGTLHAHTPVVHKVHKAR